MDKQEISEPTRDKQLIALRAAAPMRPVDRVTADVDGLPMFDAIRSPGLFD